MHGHTTWQFASQGQGRSVRRRRPPALSLVTVFLMLLAACGGSSSTPPGTTAESVRIDAGPGGTSEIKICCEGDNIYAVWTDARNGASDIYFNVSRDRGATWLEQDVRLDTDTAGSAASTNPKICCAAHRVHVVWEDVRDGESDIYYNGSRDRGATWQAQDRRLDTNIAGQFESSSVQVCCHESGVYVVWKDRRNGGAEDNQDIYFNASEDGGTTWFASDVRIGTDRLGEARSSSPRICCYLRKVYVAWKDQRNAGTTNDDDIYFSRSTDGGQTWLPADVRLDAAPQGDGDADAPDICCDNDSVYVVWNDDRNGDDDVFANASHDGGMTWLGEQRLESSMPGDAYGLEARVCCDGDFAHVVWVDERSRVDRIYYNRTEDGGVTWAGDRRIDHADQGSADIATICCSQSWVFIAWSDDRNDPLGGMDEAWVNTSSDHGATWRDDDVRLPAGGPADADEVQACCRDNHVFVAWLLDQGVYGGSHAAVDAPE